MAGITWWRFYFRLFPGPIRGPQVIEFLTGWSNEICRTGQRIAADTDFSKEAANVGYFAQLSQNPSTARPAGGAGRIRTLRRLSKRSVFPTSTRPCALGGVASRASDAGADEALPDKVSVGRQAPWRANQSTSTPRRPHHNISTLGAGW